MSRLYTNQTMSETKQDYVEFAKNLLNETKDPETLVRCGLFLSSMNQQSAILALVENRAILDAINAYLTNNQSLDYFMRHLWWIGDRELCKYMLEKRMLKPSERCIITFESNAVFKNKWKDCLLLIKTEINRTFQEDKRPFIPKCLYQKTIDLIDKLLTE